MMDTDRQHGSRGHATDRKRQQFTTPQRRRPSTPAILIGGTALLFALVLGAVMLPSNPAAGQDVAVAGPPGADVTLPLAAFDDGQARFYRYVTRAGREVRFFVMKSSDGIIRAAFDACDTCFEKRRGYRQQGDVMVCNNCNQTFRSTDINVLKGGCNPAPIERAIAGDQLRLSAAALDAGAGLF